MRKAVEEDVFVTSSGKSVVLRIVAKEKDIGKVAFAMDSLKQAHPSASPSCLAVWLSGCLAVWLSGCLAVWLAGWLADWLAG
jgi:hypothetical protein